MAERSISQGYWNDPYIQKLNSKEKLLYIYLFCNEHDNFCGFYEITLKTISIETDLKIKDVETALSRFIKDGKIEYQDNLLFLFNMAKRQNATRAGYFKTHVIKTAEKYQKYLGNKSYQLFIKTFLSVLGDSYKELANNNQNKLNIDNNISDNEEIDNPCIRDIEGLLNPSQSINNNIQYTIDNKLLNKGGVGGNKTISAFRKQPPEENEVIAYFNKMGYDKNEAEKFFSYYASQGWCTSSNVYIGGNWQNKANYWVRNQISYQNNNNGKKDNGRSIEVFSGSTAGIEVL